MQKADFILQIQYNSCTEKWRNVQNSKQFRHCPGPSKWNKLHRTSLPRIVSGSAEWMVARLTSRRVPPRQIELFDKNPHLSGSGYLRSSYLPNNITARTREERTAFYIGREWYFARFSYFLDFPDSLHKASWLLYLKGFRSWLLLLKDFIFCEDVRIRSLAGLWAKFIWKLLSDDDNFFSFRVVSFFTMILFLTIHHY